MKTENSSPGFVLGNLSYSPYVDLSGARMLAKLRETDVVTVSLRRSERSAGINEKTRRLFFPDVGK
jgi:hypothetical protein